MNEANKIDARYSVAQAIQETGQDICVAKNIQQFFGIRTLLVYFQRVKYTNGATKCLGGIAFQWKS